MPITIPHELITDLAGVNERIDALDDAFKALMTKGQTTDGKPLALAFAEAADQAQRLYQIKLDAQARIEAFRSYASAVEIAEASARHQVEIAELRERVYTLLLSLLDAEQEGTLRWGGQRARLGLMLTDLLSKGISAENANGLLNDLTATYDREIAPQLHAHQRPIVTDMRIVLQGEKVV